MSTARLSLPDAPGATDNAGLGDDFLRALNTALEAVVPVIVRGNRSALPAAGDQRRVFIAVDTGEVLVDTGTAWLRVPPAPTSGTLAARPAAAVAGRRYYATDVKAEFLDLGTSWARTWAEPFVVGPSGLINLTAGGSPTSGLLAYGNGGPLFTPPVAGTWDVVLTCSLNSTAAGIANLFARLYDLTDAVDIGSEGLDLAVQVASGARLERSTRVSLQAAHDVVIRVGCANPVNSSFNNARFSATYVGP